MQHVLVTGLLAECGALVLLVSPAWRYPRCSRCGLTCPGYDTLSPRDWRHLDFGGVRVLLRYAPRRVSCPRCGVVVERVPWNMNPRSRFTTRFEEAIAYMAQRCDKTSVTEIFGIAWTTVGSIIKRVVERFRPEDPLAGLTRIGVDEISYRKGHRYLTLVLNHDTGRIVWAKKGKDSDTLTAFFAELGEERCRAIEFVTIDMSKAYIKAVRDNLPNAQIVFDRFHVQKLAGDAMDKTRTQEWQRLRRKDPEATEKIKGLMWSMRKLPWNRSSTDFERMSTLQQENRRLYRAYLLKDQLGDILDRKQPNVVEKMLTKWISWATHSRLPEFVRVGKTIREHFEGILAYVKHRLTNGVTEGMNTKVRMINRRAYGFHSASAAIGMIMLCCTGIVIAPPRFRFGEPT